MTTAYLDRRDATVDPSSLTCIGDRVLIRIDDRVEKIGSIVVPHIARDLPNTGTVIAVGPLTTCCTPGDHVLIEKYAHGDREFLKLGSDAARHLLVEHEQVIAVLEEAT